MYSCWWDCGNPEAANASGLVVTQLTLTVNSAAIGHYQRCDVAHNSSAYRCRCSQVGGQGAGRSLGCNSSVGVADVVDATASKHFQPNSTSPEYFWWLLHLLRYANGQWWSTLSDGQCGGDSRPSTSISTNGGCTWRVAAVHKRIAKPCLDHALVRAVQRRNTSCFRDCGDSGSSNVSDPCFTQCFFGTILGPLVGGAGNWSATSGMPLEDLVAAWDGAFESCAPV